MNRCANIEVTLDDSGDIEIGKHRFSAGYLARHSDKLRVSKSLPYTGEATFYVSIHDERRPEDPREYVEGEWRERKSFQSDFKIALGDRIKSFDDACKLLDGLRSVLDPLIKNTKEERREYEEKCWNRDHLMDI